MSLFTWAVCTTLPSFQNFRFYFSLSFFFLFLVDVLLKAVGDTPIMKTKKWALERGRTVQSVSQFISRYLKLSANEQLVSISSLHGQ